MLNLRPVKMMPVREQAASSLREAIITQKIKQGETLALEATAKALGISVTPVREAFQILARDGLIELAQNRGAVVLGMSAKNIREHYQIRAALEAEACRIVCENKADLSEIEHCIGHLVSPDAENYGDLNQSFHYNIWLTCSANCGTVFLWDFGRPKTSTRRNHGLNTRIYTRCSRPAILKVRQRLCVGIFLGVWRIC